MQLVPIPIFHDNYVWLLADENNHCVVVDPGDAAPVEQYLRTNNLTLCAILITHHHPDHTAGIGQLVSSWDVPVYGPDNADIQGITQVARDGQRIDISLPRVSFEVMAVPGHTLDHIAFYTAELFLPSLSPSQLEPQLLTQPRSQTSPQSLVFCGDTLFASGCGRLFEGTPAQMDASLQRLASLPDHCIVCCTHEYTEANLRFSLAVMPNDAALIQRRDEIEALRGANKPSLPSTIATEKRCNLFLRVDEKAVKEALECELSQPLTERNQRFAALRQWKDRF